MKNFDAKSYNPKDIEPKWQQVWADTKLYQAVAGDTSRPKYYMLTEFPYPSGDGLHAGHTREYTLGDVIARHKRMQGYNVLYPMGFDAFGLPTENYAIKHRIRPQDATATNVANFRKQFDALGYSFDWDREINTTDPDYYRWTQWLFLKFLETGLAYQAEMAINWCPKEKTGLANEEVVDGKHERCGTPVEKKLLKQWMFGITKYADRLIEGLKSVDYPSRIADQQINWIGRSEGAEIDFDILGSQSNYVLLHGYTGSPEANFFPWLKSALAPAAVDAPQLPETNNPSINQQADHVLNESHFDSDTILFGHSLGAPVALKVLEKLNHPIKKLILAAGFAQPGFIDRERPFEKTFDWQFDYEAIKRNVGEVVLLRAKNDSAVPPERADYLAEMLHAKVIDVEAEADHFTGQTEPAILEALQGQDVDEYPVSDSLKFTSDLTRLIQSGEKTSTVRLEAKKLKIGDFAQLITRVNSNETSAFAIAKITNVKTLRLEEGKLEEYRGYYGKEVTLETEFTKYDFEVVAPIVTVYTTRPDTLAGATFLVLAPEHSAVGSITTAEQKAAVEAYVKKAGGESEVERQNTDREKTGVFTGAYATNPLTGEKMPVWVADYVLGGYGTGAIMAVPAHDERDHAFAAAFDLPIKPVIEPVTGSGLDNPELRPSIVAVLLNEAGDQVLSMNHPGRHDNWGGHLLIGGGIDEGETPFETATREIREETGYTDIELIETAPFQVNHRYYSSEKKVNRLARTTGFLFKLKSDAKTDVAHTASELAGKLEPVWLPLSQAASNIKDEMHSFWLSYFTAGGLYAGYGLLANSGQFDGLEGAEAKRAIVKFLEDKGIGRTAVKFKLRDWIFSRQHYWGEPIPVIHCPKDGVVPVPEDQLPVTLPDVEHYEPTETGESPLAAITDWVNVDCPKCGRPAQRETDTMPNWAGSSWYYLRYMDAKNDQEFASKEALDYWKEVDLYLGGMEHTTLHLLYSRFWHQFLYDQGLVPTAEPYAARRGQGIVLAADGRKMSKSIGNVVNPTDIIATHGADTLRLYILFMAPYDESTAWSEDRLNGASRFVYRVWTLFQETLLPPGDEDTVEGLADDRTNPGPFELEVDKFTHKTIQKIHNDLHEMRFNTVISTLMEYVNFLTKAETKHRLSQAHHDALRLRTAKTLILLLAPVTPHLAEELWHELGEEESVHVSAWPKYDPELVKDDIVTIAIQVNGKVRASILAEAAATEDELKEAAAAEPKVAAYLAQGQIIKTIVIPRKVVNFVVRP